MTEVTIKKVDVPGLETCTVEIDDWETLQLCPVCLSGVGSTVLTKVQDGAELSVCRDCQFGFLSRRPSKEWINLFYASEWDQKGQRVIPSVPINLKAFNICKENTLLSGFHRVLEIGAGYGGMLLPFRDAGHLVGAVEPSQHRAENLTGQGVEVFKEIPTTGDWDLVIMHHSLEHVYEPHRTVKDVSKALRTGGRFLALVPYFHQEHAIQASHYVPHLSLFTPYSLAKLVSQNGLYPVVTRGMELQCIARKGAGGANIEHNGSDTRAGQWAWENERFDKLTEKWALQGLASGPLTAAWTIDHSEQDRYPSLSMVGHLDARSLLQVKQEHLRTLWLDSSEKPELPITYIHENTNPVWVK